MSNRPAGPPPEGRRPTWWLEAAGGAGQADAARTGARPGMGRFLTVAASQLVSVAGSALTGWAIPVWIYLQTGSLGWLGLSGVLAMLSMLPAMPAAGVVADRADRRRVLMAAAGAAGAVELALAALLWTRHASLTLVYAAMVMILVAVTFQRITFNAATPQLVPKRYLGNANGVTQVVNGAALLLAPPVAAALLATIGLAGILAVDLTSYLVSIAVLAVVRFPDLLGVRRKEAFWPEVLGGWRLCWGTPQWRAFLVFCGAGNLLYAPALLLVTPLVLGFAGLPQVGQAGLAEGLGGLAGGLAMAVWGGPRRRRMVCIMVAIAAAAGSVVLTGLRPDLRLVLAGIFGSAFALALTNGIYLTVVQVKVPQRFHGRVISLNQTITWSTIPIAFAALVPASGALNPLLAAHGALAGTVGAVVGVGPGRGIGLAYVLLGLAQAALILVALRIRTLTRLDAELPDALPDDMVGARALQERAA